MDVSFYTHQMLGSWFPRHQGLSTAYIDTIANMELSDYLSSVLCLDFISNCSVIQLSVHKTPMHFPVAGWAP